MPHTRSAQAAPQDIPIGVTYICSGEHIYIENCNIRDTSDTANCMVAHPDHLTPTGMNSYTYVSRGALKKAAAHLPAAHRQALAAAKAFQQKQQDIYNANVPEGRAADEGAPARRRTSPAAHAPDRAAEKREERAMRRCVSSGRLPASCTGNSLLGAFGADGLLGAPGADKKPPPPGPDMAGVFQGAGNWRLDFIDGGVLVNCSFLSPNQEAYSLKFEGESHRAHHQHQAEAAGPHFPCRRHHHRSRPRHHPGSCRRWIHSRHFHARTHRNPKLQHHRAHERKHDTRRSGEC